MAGGPEIILLQILIIILGAKLGGELAERFKQPAVLGELLVGVALGASLLGGFLDMPDFALQQEVQELEERLHDDPHNATLVLEAGEFYESRGTEQMHMEILLALATIGVILLLFEVGLESDIKELTRVGASSLLVAALGILVSFLAGYGFSVLLASWWDPWQVAGEALPPHLLHIFLGATLTATSVGITARVLGDMGRLRSREARIILGAAVLDDIGGLIILAIVAALAAAAATGDVVSPLSIVKIAALAVGFLVVSLLVGLKTVPRLYDGLVDRFRVTGFPVALAIVFALLMAYLASFFGLADIVGAFAGGLILAQTRHSHHIFEQLRPIATVFVSFFFVTLGMRVDLTQMEGHTAMVLVIGGVLSVVAILAKLTCGWGILKGVQASRWVVGVGMVPRGEVGLIFAAMGLSTGIIANWQYTMVILVVMVTTFITPIWLKRLGDSFKGVGARMDTERAERLGQILEA